MKWKEFKEEIEKQGVCDDWDVVYMDFRTNKIKVYHEGNSPFRIEKEFIVTDA
jgi:hypothetical protein